MIKTLKIGYHLLETNGASTHHSINPFSWRSWWTQEDAAGSFAGRNSQRFNYHLQMLLSGRYFSVIICMLILVGLEACSLRGVEETPQKPTPAALEKTVSVDQRAHQAMTRGDYKTGIRLYEQIIAKDPKNSMAFYYLGYAYGQTGDRFREAMLYEKAISLGYKSDQIFHNLGEAYLGLGQIEESVQAFKQGLAINSKSADNHFGLAKAFQETLQYSLAEKELLITIRLEPKVIEFREYLGLFYLETGQLNKAAEQFEHILEIDSDHEGAREFLKQIVKEEALKKKKPPGMGGQ